MKKKEKQIKWLFQELRGAGKLIFVQAIAGTTQQIILLIMAAYVMVEVVNFLTGESSVSLVHLAGLSVVLLIAYLISLYLFTVFGTRVRQILWRNSRERIFKAIYNRKLSLLQKNHSAELQMLLNDDSSKTSESFANIFTHFLADVVIGIGALVMMLMFNWQVAIVMLIAYTILAILYKLFMSLMQKAAMRQQRAEEAVRLNLQEGMMKMLLLKAYGMASRFIVKHNELYEEKLKAAISNARAVSLYNMTSGVMTFCNYFIIYGIGGYFVYIGEITVGELVGMASLSGFFQSPMFKFGLHLQSLATASASAKRIRAVIELPEEAKVSDVGLGQIKELDVQDLYFSYDDESILNGVSLNAKPGDIIGVIGESGSGKSTFTKVLMGFYTPKSGGVQLIDQDGKIIDNILNHMAYVPSSDFVFTSTVKENICMTNPVVQEEMINATKAAGIHEFIESLPEKYDTLIGEGLNSLSSGQSQRIGIARALYANKPILIFDEPTSNLDVDAISNLHETIKESTNDKICLIVTHDLATKEICNKVYVIENGHMELLT